MGEFGRQTISNKNKSLVPRINAKQTEVIGETTSQGVGYLPPGAELQITKFEYCSYYVLFRDEAHDHASIQLISIYCDDNNRRRYM